MWMDEACGATSDMHLRLLCVDAEEVGRSLRVEGKELDITNSFDGEGSLLDCN